ncbi:MAG: hypothetical protein MJA83_08925 [Gammaproteobacteria bacterium]|nr:hypothetical protein [Gammaproteobacteria bacterium]
MAKAEANKKTEFLSIRVSQPVKRKLQKLADDQDRPLSWVVNKILEKYVNSKNYGKL